MKAEKSKKDKRQTLKVVSLQQFKELYFPSLVATEKEEVETDKENYGDIIAMSIIDGIKRDLSTLRK